MRPATYSISTLLCRLKNAKIDLVHDSGSLARSVAGSFSWASCAVGITTPQSEMPDTARASGPTMYARERRRFAESVWMPARKSERADRVPVSKLVHSARLALGLSIVLTAPRGGTGNLCPSYLVQKQHSRIVNARPLSCVVCHDHLSQ